MRIHYAILLSSFCLTASLLHLNAQAADETPSGKTNIVLILADDLGVNDLGCYGRTEHRTPRLDQLAQSGVRFTSAYTGLSICSPSRAALMTGKNPARLHLTNYLPGRPDAPSQRVLQPRIAGQLPLEEVTLAESLRSAGYATGLFGKWHLGGQGFGPREQGFDEAVEVSAESGTGDDLGKSEFAITDAAIRFIEEHRDQPFFCYIPHHNPHIPLRANAAKTAKFRDAFQPTYAAMIETLDDSVGKLLDALDRLDLSKNTIVIFTSDNGGLHVLESPETPATHNQPFRAGKGYLYEGGLREPLIIRWPELTKAGTVSDQPVQLTDLMPTLLSGVGLDVSKTIGPLDGQNIRPELRGEATGQRSFYWHFPNYTNQGGRPASAIRDGQWKLLEQLEDGSVELYDLANDLSEKTNLASTNQEKAKELHQKLIRWRERIGAQMPKPNPNFDEAMHRALYITQDSSQLTPSATAAETAIAWRDWRSKMNAAVKGQRPNVTIAKDEIRLAARDAIVHAKQMRYEPEPHKNVLGYWTMPEDWAEWKFDVSAPGRYEVEVQQGCGDGCGGSEVLVTVNDQPLRFIVQETGHFQHMILRTIGEVELKSGPAVLQIRPQSKPGPAVMDIRTIILRPAL